MPLNLILIHINVFLISSILSTQTTNLDYIRVYSNPDLSTNLLNKNLFQVEKETFSDNSTNFVFAQTDPSPDTNQSGASASTSSNTDQSQSFTIYSALITSGVAFVVGILTFVYNRASLAESKRKERRESITKKLNEFYGPLNSYLKIIYEFNVLLKTDKPKDFRTLTHFLDPNKIYEDGTQVVLSESDRRIISEIIDLEKEIEKLVTSKGGLIDDPAQANLLAKAIAHFRILRLAFNKEITGDVNRFESFVYPRPLDQAVQNRIEALQNELKDISTPGWIENLFLPKA